MQDSSNQYFLTLAWSVVNRSWTQNIVSICQKQYTSVAESGRSRSDLQSLACFDMSDMQKLFVLITSLGGKAFEASRLDLSDCELVCMLLGQF